LPHGQVDLSAVDVNLVDGWQHTTLHLAVIQPEGVKHSFASFAAEVTRKQFLAGVGDTGQVGAEVGAGLALSMLVPRKMLAIPLGVPLLVQCPQALVRVLGNRPHSRFRLTQTVGLRQDLLGSFLEAIAGQSHQTDDAFGAGGEAVVPEAGFVIEGEQAVPAATAVVVAAPKADRPQKTVGSLGSITLEQGCPLAMRASHSEP
jgi:hypothetical protein